MSSDLYVAFHLPKTAGTTLLATFRANFHHREWLLMSPSVDGWQRETILSNIEKELKRETSNTRCVFGHWAYFGIHERVRPDAKARYITFLRDPVERCISLYGFVKSRPQCRHHEAIASGKLSMEQWIEQGDVLELLNGQTRRLCFDGSSDIFLEAHLRREHLELAKERLRAFWFIGFTDSFDEDALTLYGMMNFWLFHPERARNVTPHKPCASPEEKEALLQANQLDTELLSFARQLRRDWEREHAEDVARFRRRARIRKRLHLYRLARPLYDAGRKLRGPLKEAPTR